MPDINSVLIAGNLTRDPAFRKTTNGTPVTNFWIASNRRFKDNNGQWRENVCYVGVVAWYKLAENCAENLKKGYSVVIEGELQSRSFKTEDGHNRNIVEIKARRVQFLNRKDAKIGAGIGDEENGKDELVNEEQKGLEETSETNMQDQSVINDNDLSKTQTKEQIDEVDKGNPLNGEYDFGYKNLKL
jgi:single-strand DNA-binding protein